MRASWSIMPATNPGSASRSCSATATGVMGDARNKLACGGHQMCPWRAECSDPALLQSMVRRLSTTRMATTSTDSIRSKRSDNLGSAWPCTRCVCRSRQYPLNPAGQRDAQRQDETQRRPRVMSHPVTSGGHGCVSLVRAARLARRSAISASIRSMAAVQSPSGSGSVSLTMPFTAGGSSVSRIMVIAPLG